MLEPRVRPEGLDEPSLQTGIFEDAPVIGAVSKPLARISAERVEERFPILRIDAVIDRHQNRPSVRLYLDMS